MSIHDAATILIALYFSWGVIYCFLWGSSLYRSKYYEGIGPMAKCLSQALLQGIYPLFIAAGLCALDRGVFQITLSTPGAARDIALYGLFSDIRLPTVILFFIVSALCHNATAHAAHYIKGYLGKKLVFRACIAFGAGLLLNVGLLSAAIHFLLAGETELAAWMLLVDSFAFLLTQLVRVPSCWPDVVADWRSSETFLNLLLVLLRIAVVLLGGWLTIAMLKFPDVPAKLAKFGDLIGLLLGPGHVPTIWEPLAFVAVMATVLVLVYFLITKHVIFRFFRYKIRPMVAFFLLLLLMQAPLFFFLKGAPRLYGMGLMIFGQAYSFFFFGVAPRKGDLNQVYPWTWFYSAASGATFLALTALQALEERSSMLYLPIVLLYTLLTGMAVGLTARILYNEDYLKPYFKV